MGSLPSTRRLASATALFSTLFSTCSSASALAIGTPSHAALRAFARQSRVVARYMSDVSNGSEGSEAAAKERGERLADATASARGKAAVNKSKETRKANLYGLSDDELLEMLTEMGEKKFRVKQVREALFGEKPASSIEEMTTLSKGLRAKLAATATFGELAVAHEQISKDGTQKRLWRCHDGSLIESVLMPYDTKRRTACISSQVGCAMGCTFCATGQMGFSRDLSEGEIFEQAARFSAELRARDERLSNVVFMGMGEPFRNYDAVMGAARRIMKDLGIGARHITISTVGVVPNIVRFADEGLEIKLAISLHESEDQARSAIMPVNRKYDLAELLDACKYYVAQSGRRISFEWALISGRNDDAASALALAQRLKGLKCHVNLIPLNPTKGFEGQPTSLPRADEFIEVLARHRIPATIRVRRGIDIDAGCGQLADAASKEVAAERLLAKLEKADVTKISLATLDA